MAMTILYADDDCDDRTLLSDALRQLDPSINCITVSNGREAIEWLGVVRHLPDYIFLDINMPIMNGRECLAELKGSEKYRHIPIVMYSTTSDPAESRFYYDAGITYFLRKPNSFNQLCSALSTFLKNAREEMSKEIKKDHSQCDYDLPTTEIQSF
jgi:CheY-like chemotaxis protein